MLESVYQVMLVKDVVTIYIGTLVLTCLSRKVSQGTPEHLAAKIWAAWDVDLARCFPDTSFRGV